MRGSTRDLAAGAFSLLFAAAFYAQSGKLKGLGLDYPLGLIIFISLGGLFLLAQGLRKRLSGRDAIPADAEPAAYRRVALITAASAAYALLVALLGFYTASTVFLFGSAMALNDAGWGWKKSAVAA
ncbi:MAG: tripartite tricarboxylate transporter TctB family protein, partial [Deltaproteobacteria bacterium]|nr:tripartite tricarboxylate transporter TctB family protein [Deltaproteobacteria bacterium]